MARMGIVCATILAGLLGFSIKASYGQQHAVTIDDFLRALASNTDAARVEYLGTCDATSPNRIIPPDVMVANAKSSLRGLAMVRAMLGKTKDVAVGESAGVIHVEIGAMDESFVQSRIKLLRLTHNQQYDPSEAIWALENSRAFRLKARNRNMRVALMQGGLESIPAEGEPHLPSTMQNLNVDEILSEIARTFSGTVVYGECLNSSGQAIISIRFIGG